MSVNKEEDVLRKLQLIQAVSHAWVKWDTSASIEVEESNAGFILPKGQYELANLLSKDDLKKLMSLRSVEHSNKPSSTGITIHFNENREEVEWAMNSFDGQVYCLLTPVNKKDDSIAYLQTAAHDFRSPLGSIIGVINLLQLSIKSDEPYDDDEFVTLLDMIKVNADKALNLAGEIMELAEIEREEYELRLDPLVAKDFVKHYTETHRLLTLKKHIKVQLDFQSDARALINESKLTRVLDNLVTNAVKFSKPGSTITFSLDEDEEHVLLKIKDEGIGMSEDILKNLFVKFGTAKRKGLDGEATHGLGMSIVRQIMYLHHGDVKVSSEEGVGTQVSLILNKAK